MNVHWIAESVKIPSNTIIFIAQQFVIQYVSHQNATLPVLSPRTQFAMLNVKNQNAKLNVQTKAVKCLTAQNVWQFANNPIALLTAKPPNQNVNQYVKNQDVIGNATNQIAPNQNVS